MQVYALCNNVRMNVQRVVREIRAFMADNGFSESGLARAVHVPQSTLHRALKNPVRLTKTHRALCKFAGIDLAASPASPDTKEELVQELLDVWDGSREHAHSLARLLRVAATLQAHAAAQGSRAR